MLAHDQVRPGRGSWFARAGALGLAFFLLKGLAWLAIGSGALAAVVTR